MSRVVAVALIRRKMYTYRDTDLTARRSRAVTARCSWNNVSRVVAVALIRGRYTHTETLT